MLTRRFASWPTALRAVAAVAAMAAIASGTYAQQRGATPAPANARPRLIVLLVADQFRGDYPRLYGHQWTKGLRRLYDTGESRYITLEELSEKIRAGQDVRVVDAKTNEDLTQATLTQIIIESRGAARLLPPQLLTQLIRLGDDSLAEFFNR